MFARLFRQGNRQHAPAYKNPPAKENDEYEQRAKAAIEAEIAAFSSGKRRVTTVMFARKDGFAEKIPHQRVTLVRGKKETEEYNQQILQHRNEVIATPLYKRK